MSMLNSKEFDFPYTDRWVFPIVMQEQSICRQFLERLFPGRVIRELNVKDGFTRITPEKYIQISAFSHGIQLDVMFEGDDQIYDIEMQMRWYTNIPKRSRYYHTMMDASFLKHAEDYSKLKPQYVIFICPFDPFKMGEAIYSFETMSKKTGLKLDEGRYTIFLNTTSSETVIPEGFSNYFKYINGEDVDDSDGFIREIHDKVTEVNQSPDWRESLMTLREEVRLEFADDLKENAKKTAAETKMEVAKNLIAANVDKDIIAKATGLSLEEIDKLL